MTKDEALKLALEALENASDIMDSCAQKRQDDAITAIKEALAQPEQETLAWEQFYPDMGKPQLAPPHPWEKFCDSNCVWTDHHPDCKLAQPEQERFLVATIGNWGRVEWVDGVFPSLGDKMYSAPRTWVGLTLDEVLDMARTFGAQPWPPNSCAALGKMIEAKLKEKNT
jgi:hypothetical protein